MEEMMEALDMLIRHGQVRYIGVSNWAAWQVVKALGIADCRNLAPIRLLQAYYTLAGRDFKREIIPM
jgi:aryl-alcohol dehydrogenase-like predicted oxidoreductase